MLVDGKQKIAHELVLFVHQHLFISPLLFVSPEIAWKPPICAAKNELDQTTWPAPAAQLFHAPRRDCLHATP